MDFELERFVHLYAVNRGVPFTPFHRPALRSREAEADHFNRHTRIFRDALKELTA
jgi:glutamate-1-semialdehyde 2,1-aminomutase